MLKDIDLTNKCGSCDHFKPIEDTTTGECLQYPYDDSVVHDPKHPHWIVQRSRIKCRLYNAKPLTNADRIRAMSDEELAVFVRAIICAEDCPATVCDCDKCFFKEPCFNGSKWHGKETEWLKQPAEGE